MCGNNTGGTETEFSQWSCAFKLNAIKIKCVFFQSIQIKNGSENDDIINGGLDALILIRLSFTSRLVVEINRMTSRRLASSSVV